MDMRRGTRALVAGGALAWLAATAAAGEDRRETVCNALAIPEYRLEPPPSQYAAFCERRPEACQLTGPAVIDWESSRSLLERINGEVNAAVALTSDVAEYGLEECWRFPVDGAGDCEDFALEKRRLLAAAGLPSAALTMAIVHHEVQFFPHAVLLAETTGGTWVLDNLADELMCWDALPYRYERRERPDGQWVRYVVR